jgi:hypothetical protein
MTDKCDVIDSVNKTLENIIADCDTHKLCLECYMHKLAVVTLANLMANVTDGSVKQVQKLISVVTHEAVATVLAQLKSEREETHDSRLH